MKKVSIETKDKEEVLTDVIQASALEKTALAELIDAEAEDLKRVMDLDDITVDKLIQLQEKVDSVLSTGLELQKSSQADLEATDYKTKKDNSEVLEVEEEIVEVEEDGTKKIKKVITKQKKE
ncbi:hypothetical protein Halha_1390 [Halobacteroides halobius DSM 5150]|uniref:Uncharacterized protein n=1 Tax=Halobacteroides halobius (strain ATCC 35273 / DSM 5150 / MD-1) TaxID=748449 RepID=L0K9Y9_HALHC|nr:hypothetical protein [Halobacteroides halobius]AGB41335.1 hypothetical protein Halha_1390 [Halobacteroides halobius DSM 5150]